MELILYILLIALYFLPSIIGYNHRNSGSIIILNLLLGWTLIGWIVALIWAISNDKKEIVVIHENNINKEYKSENSTDELIKLKELLESGYINQDEFSIQKNKILNK